MNEEQKPSGENETVGSELIEGLGQFPPKNAGYWKRRCEKAEDKCDRYRDSLGEAERLLAQIYVVGSIDLHDVIRRGSVLDIIRRFRA